MEEVTALFVVESHSKTDSATILQTSRLALLPSDLCKRTTKIMIYRFEQKIKPMWFLGVAFANIKEVTLLELEDKSTQNW